MNACMNSIRCEPKDCGLASMDCRSLVKGPEE